MFTTFLSPESLPWLFTGKCCPMPALRWPAYKSREETHTMVCVLYTWLFWACFRGRSGSWYGHLFVLESSSLLLICSSLFQSSCPLFHCGGEDFAGRGTVSLRLSRVLVAPGTMTLSLVSKPRTISTHFLLWPGLWACMALMSNKDDLFESSFSFLYSKNDVNFQLVS